MQPGQKEEEEEADGKLCFGFLGEDLSSSFPSVSLVAN